MKPACMDDAEYALWEQANNVAQPRIRARRPCSDCPMSFYQEMRAINCCDGYPQMRIHPPLTPAESRAKWAAAQRRRRAERKMMAAGLADSPAYP